MIAEALIEQADYFRYADISVLADSVCVVGDELSGNPVIRELLEGNNYF